MKNLIAAIALAASLLPPSLASADAFDNANAYLGAKYGVPDFEFDRTEFGNSNFQRVIHLGIEILVEKIVGGIVVYVPATGEQKVFKDAGNGYSEPIQTEASMASCGPGHWFIQNVGGAVWCTPAHLVGASGGSYHSHTIPAVARECTFEVDLPGAHEHTC